MGILAYAELLAAGAAAVLWYRQGGAIWYAGLSTGPWPFLLLGLMWVFYWVRTGFRLRVSGVDVLLVLFVLSAWLGTQTAYDPGRAWAKFWLVAGAWGLYYAFVHQPDAQHLYGALALCGLFGVALTGYYLLTNDWWDKHTIKIPGLVALSEAVSSILPRLSTHSISPNVTGGMLAAVLPFYVPLITMLRKGTEVVNLQESARRGLQVIWVLAVGWTGFGLLLTTSRGAWVATCAGFSLWLLWRCIGKATRRMAVTRQWTGQIGLMAVILCLVAATGFVSIYLILINGWAGADVISNRLTLFQDTLLLARDYGFTGMGLGAFLMNFSIYTLLIHVGYIYSSHNFFLDLLVEQGILGLATYLGLITIVFITAIRHIRNTSLANRWSIEAGLVALAVILIHGMVDDTLYGSRGLMLLFIPMSITILSSRSVPAEQKPLPVQTKHAILPAAITVGAVLIGAWIMRSSLIASFYANLGAVEQGRIELASYDPERFNERPMDTVRQEVNLDAAIFHFEHALRWNPENLTAHQRLASIDLSRGAYESALAHMTAAWEVGHRDSVTRLLYGDALVAMGQIEQAAAVIDGLTWAERRLDGQAWSRYWVHEDWVRAAYTWHALELLDPGNTTAQERARAAETRASQQP